MATQKRFIAKNGLDNNSLTIQNVADPVNAQDAATRAYVLANASSSGVSSVNTRTGAVTLTSADVGLGNVTNNAAVANLSGTNTGDQTIPTTLPASDVYAWAKAATKPTYTYTEVGAQVAGTYATGTGSATGTNTGDETSTTIKSALGITTLSGSNTGDQTSVSGNAGTATTLATARNINGVSFDGSANITINAVDSTARIASSLIGAANGVAPLGSDSKISSTYLPSYVDDVLEYANLAGFPASGETGKIYVALDTNKTYRWSGSAYIYITSGAVDSVAGRTGVVTLTSADVGLGNVSNTAQVTSVSGTAPIVSSGGTTPAISMAAATASVNGYMTSTYATKLDGISAGATANTGTVTSVAALTLGTTGSDVSSTVVTGTTTPVITLNIPTASATNRGALSSTDWGIFNGKQAAGAYLTSAVTSVGGTGTVSGLTLTGTVTSTGSLTLGGTLALGSLNTLGTAAGLSATLIVGSGGTGVTTLTGIPYGNGTSAFTVATAAQLVTAIGASTTLVAGSMSSADKTKLDAITGTNTGNETGTTIRTALGITTLSGSNTGDQTTITGNAGSATNITGGVAGSVPYQTAASTTAMTAASTVAGQVLTTVTAGGAPTWQAPAGSSGLFNPFMSASVGYLVTTSLAAAFTAPATAGLRYIVHSIHVTNIGTVADTITAEISGTTYSGGISLSNTIPIPVAGSVELLKKPKVMQPSDILNMISTQASTLHTTIAYEISSSSTYFGVGVNITTDATYTDLYTMTGNSVLESIFLVNDSIDSDAKVTLVWTDGANAIQGYFAYNFIVALNSTIEILEKPKYIASGYKLRVQSNIGNRVEAIVAGKTL